MNKRAIVPNFITLGNLFLGFSALLLISNERYVIACWLLVAAGILDGLDGLTARLFKSNSKFGAEIDSLVDVVSFGVVPAMLVYKVFFYRFGLIGILLSFLPLLGGVLRLARYNSTPQTKYRGFIGLPIPSSAGALASFVIYINFTHGGFTDKAALVSLVIAVSLLMVSPIPYRRMPVIIIRGSRFPQIGIIFWIIVLSAFIWEPALIFFPLMLIYLFSGPVEWGLKQLGLLNSNEDTEGELEETKTVTHQTTEHRFFRRDK